MLKVILLRLLRSNIVILFFSAISFIIGLLLSTVIGQFLSSQTNQLDRIIQGAILLILILLLFYLSRQFKEVKDILRRQKLSVNVSYASAKNQDRQLYDPVNEAVAEAKHSIRVVGMFRSKDLFQRKGRRGYYDVLNDLINLKIQLNQPFIYERIVQVNEVKIGVINSEQIDTVTFDHCKQVLELKKQRSAVSVHIKQIPNILGALSFLIVDNDRFFMVIPDTLREAGKLRLEGLQLVLCFEDAEGVLIEPMKSFFSRLFNEADPVLRVEEVKIELQML